MTQDLYYYESGYLTPDTGYFTYVADAEAAISSASTFTVQADKIKKATATFATAFSQSVSTGAIRNSSSTLASNFTQITYASRTEGFDLYAFANAALAADVKRLRDNNIQASTAFSVATSGLRVRYISAQADSEADITAVNQRVRYNEAAVNAAFSLSNEYTRLRDSSSSIISQSTQAISETYLRLADSSITSSFAVSCDAEKIFANPPKQADATLSIAANLTTDVNALRPTSATLASTSTLTASIVNVRGFDLVAFGNSTVTATATRIQTTGSSLTSSFTQTASLDGTKTYSSTIDSAFSISAQGRKTQDFDLVAFGDSTLDITFERIRSGASSITLVDTISTSPVATKALDSQFITIVSQSAINDRTRNVNASITTASSLSTNVIRIQQGVISCGSLFSPTITCVAIKNSFAILENRFTQTVNSQAFKGTTTTLASISSISANAVKTVIISSSITSFASITSSLIRPNRLINQSSSGTNVRLDTSITKFGSGSLLIDKATWVEDSPGVVVYGNNEICLFDVGNTWKSTDGGSTWTKTSNNLPITSGIRFRNGRYIRTDIDGTLDVSVDGYSWTTVTIDLTSFAAGTYRFGTTIEYHSGRWFIVATNTNGGFGAGSYTGNVYVYTQTTSGSPTAFSWTRSTSPIQTTSSSTTGQISITDILSDGTKVKIVGFKETSGSYENFVSSSTNLTNWARELTVTNTGQTFNKLAYSQSNGSWMLGVNYFTNVTTGTFYGNYGGNSWTTYTITGKIFGGDIFYLDGYLYAKNTKTDSSDYQLYWKAQTAGSIFTQTNFNDLNLGYAVNSTGTAVAALGDIGQNFYSSTNGSNWNVTTVPNTTVSPGWIDYKTVTPSYDFSSGIRTIDFWIHVTSENPSTSTQTDVMGCWAENPLEAASWWIRFASTTSTTNFQLVLFVEGSNSNLNSSLTVPYNQWNHVRISSSGTALSLYVNGTRLSNATSGFLPQSTGPLTLGNVGSSSRQDNKFQIRIDELLISNSTLTPTTTTSFTVPTAPWTTDANTELLLHFNGNTLDDSGSPLILSSAALPSAFSINVNAVVNKTTSKTLSSAFTTSVSASKTVPGVINLTTAAAVLTVSARRRSFVNLDVSAATLTANTQVVKVTSVSTDTAVTITAIPTKVFGPVSITSTSQFNLSATATVSSGSIVNLSSNFSQSVAFKNYVGFASSVSLASSLTATAEKVLVGTASLSSQTTQTAIGDKYVGFNATLTAQSTLTALVIKDVPFFSTPSSSFGFSCSVNRTRQVSSSISSQVNTNIVGKATKTSSQVFNAVTTQTANNQRIRNFSITTSILASEITAVVKIATDVATLSSQFNLSVQFTLISNRARATLTAVSTMTVVTTRIRTATALIASASSLSSNAGKKVNGAAALSVQGFQLVLVTVIRLDNADSYRVPSETRTWRVPRDINVSDDIVYLVPRETRSWTIPTETNYYAVELEDRIFKIKGN